jgi:hypothetical protein
MDIWSFVLLKTLSSRMSRRTEPSTAREFTMKRPARSSISFRARAQSNLKHRDYHALSRE